MLIKNQSFFWLQISVLNLHYLILSVQPSYIWKWKRNSNTKKLLISGLNFLQKNSSSYIIEVNLAKMKNDLRSYFSTSEMYLHCPARQFGTQSFRVPWAAWHGSDGGPRCGGHSVSMTNSRNHYYNGAQKRWEQLTMVLHGLLWSIYQLWTSELAVDKIPLSWHYEHNLLTFTHEPVYHPEEQHLNKLNLSLINRSLCSLGKALALVKRCYWWYRKTVDALQDESTDVPSLTPNSWAQFKTAEDQEINWCLKMQS